MKMHVFLKFFELIFVEYPIYIAGKGANTLFSFKIS
jgi:hypothetical protein